jgi:thioredoxin type arsenate reductase
MPVLKILFLCTGNSCRSQMAEGWTRKLKADCIEPYSAGIVAHGLNPYAVQVMAEAGVDILGQKSKTIAELPNTNFDYVITLCDDAQQQCPVFPGKAKVVHVAFDDPPRLAADAKTEEERLAPYRRVRDEIRDFIKTIPESLGCAMKNKSSLLRDLITSPETLVMPDAYDSLSARIIEHLGFKAVQCSGYSFSLSACCPTEAAFGFERNLAITQCIVEAVEVPVMADGEDGFGDPSVVTETVRAFIRIGVAGINLEDQVLGPPGPKRVIERTFMIEKIKAARNAARQEGVPELVINGRTDALAAALDRKEGIEEAVARSNIYLESGADMAFVTDVRTMEEVKILVEGIRGPLSIAAGMPSNIRNMSLEELKARGVARVSLPVLAIFSAIRAISKTMESLREPEGFAKLCEENLLCSPEDISALLTKK